MGFGVLSISYPVETDPPIMPSSVKYRVSDWGQQAAIITKKIIDQYSLASRAVVLIAWSMGGRMVVPFTSSAKELGLDVRQFISFAATPGISITQQSGPLSTTTGYLHPSNHIQGFCKQLQEVDEVNGFSTIPREIYIREYTGGTPINLPGLRLKYNGQNAFVIDEVTHEEDSRVFDVANLPLISAIYPTDILDARHALTDRATWGFILTLKLQNLIGKRALLNVESKGKWPQLMDLVHSAPERLSVPITGNHFFFISERGARETANKVVHLLMEGSMLQNELSVLLD
ncbi:hypothetical protein N7495_008780 [Penicillium taxi]|uniref:uncharacterized protein n=1 Tax=Penicillium taxi TaxID=168475 RepID=UPI00254573D1|nr:uncharacterized protein N7495_008780 [Penicillium taxi]KAJ5888739.1 hypothetical protein N7495_008780 [Penicillium taxi]